VSGQNRKDPRVTSFHDHSESEVPIVAVACGVSAGFKWSALEERPRRDAHIE
jgi:hypothetical protein